jgi:hypothetical protein
MDFNLVSKNNMGCVSALFLIILLSQTRFFNYLLDTTLGRSILILFILLIAYTNKILGVVVVLFIIIMFNNSDIGYIEGFTDTASTDTDDDKKKTSSPLVTDASANSMVNPVVPSMPSAPEVPSTSSTTAVEGFDIVGKERWIQKGKQSNQIPVNDSMRLSSDIAPYEKDNFANAGSIY